MHVTTPAMLDPASMPDTLENWMQQGLRIALVNNMADAALRKTEQQFRSLLGTDGGGVQLILTSLPDLPRGELAARTIADTYTKLGEALASGLDGVIVTGAEPRTAELSDEPYWPALTALFDWIGRTGTPAAYCCLAAHAAVLYRNGVRRQRLTDKCFGVFEHHVAADHALVRDAEPCHPLPHSRWNGLDPAALRSCGYTILTHSNEVGVGAFAGPAGLDLFFQGHPEYTGTTLLREYRRDVRRFLVGERDTYPAPPVGTLHEDAVSPFVAFQTRAMTDRRVALMEQFPPFAISDARQSPWRQAGAHIYSNWLRGVAARAARCHAADRMQQDRMRQNRMRRAGD